METTNNEIIMNRVTYGTTRFADDISLLGNKEEEQYNTLHQKIRP